MRILHLATWIGRRSGGIGPVVCGLAQGLHSLKYDVAIWTLDSVEAIAEAVRANDLEGCIVRCPSLGPSRFGYSPVAERMVSNTAGRQIDILHQHSIWTANTRVANRWRWLYQRPTVVSLHGTLEPYALSRSRWKKRLATSLYEGENLQRASCLHALSMTEAKDIQDYGLRNPIAVIPNGVPEAWLHSSGDAHRFRTQHSISDGKRILLFLSRLHPKKGLPLLFEAISSAQSQLKDWHLVIAGPDERGHRAELRSLSCRLGIQHMLQFVGPLFGQNKRDAFAAADVFVLPTRSEGSPVAVLESLAAGVPTLTTHGAPWEELQTYRCGWWVPIDSSSIQKALLEAVQLPKDELNAMGQRGRDLAQQHYTWEKIAKKLAVLYRWLLYGGEQPGFVIMS